MVSRIWICVFSVAILPCFYAKSVSLNKLIEAEEALSSENKPTVSKPDFLAKPVSLNKLIEAEQALPSEIKPIVSKPDFIAKHTSLNHRLEAEEKRKNKQPHRQKLIQPKGIQEKSTKLRTGVSGSGLSKTVSGTVFSSNKNVSPLHYRKTFEIKSPIRPKRVTLFQRSRLRNQSGKRDTYQHGAIHQKYIPLLRDLGVLFDNILDAESGEPDGDYSESEERVCTCVAKKTGARQKAAASARVSVTEAPPPTQAPTPTTPPPPPDNLSSLGRNPNVSLLFTRNTTGVWRNNIRVDERSRTPHLGSAERHFPGDSGDDGRHPGDGEAEADPEDHEEDTDGHTGDDAGDARSPGRGSISRGFIGKSIVSHKFKTSPNKTAEGPGGHLPEYEGEIQFEIRADKAKSTRVLPEPDPGLRAASEEVQAAKEKDVIEYSDSSNQQLSIGNGEDSEENQELRRTDEGISHTDPNSSDNDKYVMIYDGYSVARDVNGQNTLTEKAINIHS